MIVLITGGCGFVGFNLAMKLRRDYSDFRIICFDNLKRKGSELNLLKLKQSNIEFLHGDVRIASDFLNIGHIDVLIEAAAEPSVLAGINGSTDYVIDTNLNGTINCLNYALKYNALFIFLSTSRVYPIKTLESAFWSESDYRFDWTEKQNIGGLSANGVSEKLSLEGYRSLYGATKLASELIIQEYQQMFNLRTIINRCGVITGPYQMGKIDQGVVVLWAAKHYWKGKLSYIGYGGLGKQVRDMVHIEDLYRLLNFQIFNFNNLKSKLYNVGGGLDGSLSLMELTDLCERYSGNKINIIQSSEIRPADLRIYVTDNTLVTEETGWQPLIKPDQILQEIFDWIGEDEAILKDILA